MHDYVEIVYLSAPLNVVMCVCHARMISCEMTSECYDALIFMIAKWSLRNNGC